MSGEDPRLRQFHARLCDDPLGRAFDGRAPLVPWLASRPVPGAEMEAAWEKVCATPRSGKTVAYVHIPFCSNHCLFCNFYRNATRRHSSGAYVDDLLREIRREAATVMGQSAPVHAIYLGGGTPTDLDAPDLARLLRTLRECLPLAGDCEITVEGRATGFEPEKVAACLDSGANRFSFGVQTFDTRVRQRLGRRLEGREIMAFISEICRMDRAVVVCDLIFGLPGQTAKSWAEDLSICEHLGIDGVDLYCLTLLPSSPLATAIGKGAIAPGAALREQGVFYAAGVGRLERAGWRQLTTAHFTRESRERNLYNQLVKSGAACLAFGSGAGGHAGGFSYFNLPDLSRYREANAAGRKPLAGLYLAGAGHAAKGRVTGGLETGRLNLAAVDEEGVPGFAATVLPLAAQWEEAGLLHRDGEVLRLTLAGRFWHTNLASSLHRMIDLLLAEAGSPAGAPPLSRRGGDRKPDSMKPSIPNEKQAVLETLRTRFAESADGVLEMIAAQSGLTTREVLGCLPEECCLPIDGEHFAEIMEEISRWGEILLIVHTADAIIECAGPLPEGTFGRGFFNLGHGSPIRGHIRADACAEICLVRRPFMGMETCSVQFYNGHGESMFKVFVSRDEDDVLKADQVALFEALRNRFRS